MGATWTVGTPVHDVDTDGVAHISVPLLDDGVQQGAVVVTMTPDRALRIEWQAEDDTPALTDLQAWERA